MSNFIIESDVDLMPLKAMRMMSIQLRNHVDVILPIKLQYLSISSPERIKLNDLLGFLKAKLQVLRIDSIQQKGILSFSGFSQLHSLELVQIEIISLALPRQLQCFKCTMCNIKDISFLQCCVRELALQNCNINYENINFSSMKQLLKLSLVQISLKQIILPINVLSLELLQLKSLNNKFLQKQQLLELKLDVSPVCFMETLNYLQDEDIVQTVNLAAPNLRLIQFGRYYLGSGLRDYFLTKRKNILIVQRECDKVFLIQRNTKRKRNFLDQLHFITYQRQRQKQNLQKTITGVYEWLQRM